MRRAVPAPGVPANDERAEPQATAAAMRRQRSPSANSEQVLFDQLRIRSAAGGRHTDTAVPGRSCACATAWRGTLTTNGGAPGVSSATPTMQNAPRNSILATVAGSVFAAVAPFIDNAMSSGRKYSLTAAPEIKS